MGQLHDLVSVKLSLTAHIEQSEFLSVQSEGIRLSLSELLLVFRTEMVKVSLSIIFGFLKGGTSIFHVLMII